MEQSAENEAAHTCLPGLGDEIQAVERLIPGQSEVVLVSRGPVEPVVTSARSATIGGKMNPEVESAITVAFDLVGRFAANGCYGYGRA